jgi:hypothetical protein
MFTTEPSQADNPFVVPALDLDTCHSEICPINAALRPIRATEPSSPDQLGAENDGCETHNELGGEG